MVVSEPLVENLQELGGERTLRILTQRVGTKNIGKPDTFDYRITSCTQR